MSNDSSPKPSPNPHASIWMHLHGLDLEKPDTLPEVLRPLSVQQRHAVIMLGDHSLPEVCEALGLHRSTVYRWRLMPEFRRALLSLQRLGYEFIYTDASEVRRKNREVLESLRDDKEESGKVRLGAVKLLEEIMADTLNAQLDERVTALERTTNNLASRLGALRGMSNEELVEYTRRLASNDPDEMDD